MVYTLSTVIIITLLALFFYKHIHKYKYILYVISFVTAIALHEEGNYVTYGFTGLAFFIVVMYSGILEKGNLRKRLFMVRAEYAIIGTIFLFPHMLGYIELVLEEVGLFSAPINYYLGVSSGILILPLFITSFTFIRKKVVYRKWKNIHTIAYPLYGLIAFHLILINNQRQLMYILIFGSYAGLKSTMLLGNYRKKKLS